MKSTQQKTPVGILWERQPGESTKVFTYFTTYRDLPPRERTIAHVATVLKLKVGTLRVIAFRWSWTRRANAWDDHVDKQKRDAELAEIVEMSRRQARHAMQFQETLVIPSTALLKRLTKDGQISTEEFEAMDINDLFAAVATSARVFGHVVRVERLARGESTENQNVNGTLRFMPPVIIRPGAADNENSTESDDRTGTDDSHSEQPRRPG